MSLAIFWRVERFCYRVGKFWSRVVNILLLSQIFLSFTERPWLNFVFDSKAIDWKIFLGCPRMEFLNILDRCRHVLEFQ